MTTENLKIFPELAALSYSSVLANPILSALATVRDEGLGLYYDARLAAEKALSQLQTKIFPKERLSGVTINDLRSASPTFAIDDYARRYAEGDRDEGRWFGRTWDDMCHLLREAVVEERVTTYFFEITRNNTNLNVSAYETDSVAHMAGKRVEKVQKTAPVAESRAVIEGKTWVELENWAIGANIGDELLWSSPPGDGYLGARNGPSTPHRKEINHTFYWKFTKTSETRVDVTQYRAYPNLAEIAALHEKLGQSVKMDGGRPLSISLIANLIKLSPEDGQNIEAKIYQNSRSWLKQPRVKSPEADARFWLTARAYFEQFFFPVFWKQLQKAGELSSLTTVSANDSRAPDTASSLTAGQTNSPTADPINNPEKTASKPNSVVVFSQAQAAVDNMDLLTSHFVSIQHAIYEHFRTSPKEPLPFTITDNIKTFNIYSKKKLNQKITKEDAAWLATATGKAITGALSWSSSFLQCTTLAPFSSLVQLSQAGGSLRMGGMIPLSEIQQNGLVRMGDWYVPGNEVWKVVSDIKCIGENCGGKCSLFGECNMCAACDPRCVAASMVGETAKQGLPSAGSSSGASKSSSFSRQSSPDANRSHAPSIRPLDTVDNNGAESFLSGLFFSVATGGAAAA